jgi:hypothetical protein
MEKSLVIFQYTVETRHGSRVLIVGDCEELGNWDPEFAHELATDANSYPMWRVWASIPMDKVIQYKYVIEYQGEF